MTCSKKRETRLYRNEGDALAESHAELVVALDRLMGVGSAATGHLMCGFSDLHGYIEEIMGRPVFTHEMGVKSIAAEIAEKAKQPFVEAIEQARAALTKARALVPEEAT